MDSAAFRLLGFEVVERWSDPLPGMVWVTEETCRRYQLSSNRPHFGKKDDKGGYRYNVCGVIRDYRSLSALATPLSDSHGAVMILDPQVHHPSNRQDTRRSGRSLSRHPPYLPGSVQRSDRDAERLGSRLYRRLYGQGFNP